MTKWPSLKICSHIRHFLLNTNRSMEVKSLKLYNLLWLTWIVGVACLLWHELVAVLKVSFSVLQMASQV